MFRDNTGRNDTFHCLIVDWMTLLSHASEYSGSYRDCELEGSWGIISVLKYFQKQLHRRHRQWCVKRDTLIQGLIFIRWSFIAFSVNWKQCGGVNFGTLGTAYLCYSIAVSPSVYTVFSLQLSVRLYRLLNDCHQLAIL